MRAAKSSDRVRVSPSDASLKVIDVALSSCRPDPNQPRQTVDKTTLGELAQSIERHGLLQPITVKRDRKRRGHFVVVAGERRFRAFELLGRSSIPAIVTAGEADEIALIENLQREDLSPLEEASALSRLKKKHGYSLKELGSAVGKAKSTVANILKINDLPAKIKRDADAGVVGRSFLMELSRLSDKKSQLSLYAQAKQGNVTVRDLRRKSAKPSQPEQASLKRIISTGKRFVAEIATLPANANGISSEDYDELLNIYEQFMDAVAAIAKSVQSADQQKPE